MSDKKKIRRVSPQTPSQSFAHWREINGLVILSEAALIVGVSPDSDVWASVRRRIPGGEFVSFDGDLRWVLPVAEVRALKSLMERTTP